MAACSGAPARAPGSSAAAAAAERVLRLLSSSKYRKGSLEEMDFAQLEPLLLRTLYRSTRVGAPVRLTLMAFPFKVPNPAKVGSRVLPDLAELAAIRWCQALGDAIAAVYAPGFTLDIIHDGALIADVFGIELTEVRAYEAYFARLVRVAGADERIRCHDFNALQQRAGLDPTAALGALHDRAEMWWYVSRGTPEWRASFRKTCGMLQLRDLPRAVARELLDAADRGSLPYEYASLEQRVHRAMIAYHVKNAIIHEFDPRFVLFPDAIHATTRVQPGRLALWLVRRGSSLLPWHGVGALDHSCRPQVAPADQVDGRSDMRAVMLPDEDTPFYYRPTQSSGDLATLMPA